MTNVTQEEGHGPCLLKYDKVLLLRTLENEVENKRNEMLPHQNDGIRCKLTAERGEHMCEHHRYDLRAFMKNPIQTAKKFKQHWGKRPPCV